MTELAVLVSGGLDSAILLADAVRRGQRVQPIALRCGLSWERVEAAHLARFLHAIRSDNLEPLVTLDQPTADLYGQHWSVTGEKVPTECDPDEDVFLPGRNLFLLVKPLVWCHLNRVPALALGSLATNPFPDATPEFFRSLAGCANQAMGGTHVDVVLPLGGMKKTAVMRLGRGMPLEHTFSCIRPAGDQHCGRCNKCFERREAFRAADMPDPTPYAG